MRVQTKRTLITTGVLLGLLLLVIGIVVVVRALNTPAPAVETSQQTTPETAPDTGSTSKPGVSVEDSKPADSSTSTTPAFNPDTTATIDITPLSLKVYYTKGVGALSYQVLRTPSGTRYVDFQAESLVGTKCTNDTGSFASILEKPSAAEEATLSKTVTIKGEKYGLSLADDSCTSDIASLKNYQTAFSEGFDLLSHLE